MKTKVFLSLLLATIIFESNQAQEKQNRFGWELNGGISIPSGKIDGDKLNTGFGFEGIFHYRFLPHLGAYTGWGWNRMSADKSFAGDNVEFEETGYMLGLQYQNHFGKTPFGWYVRAGSLYNHVEAEDGNEIVNDTKHGFGWQAAAGIDVPLGKSWSIAPGLKFNSLSRETDFEGVNKTLDYRYLSIRVGIVKRF